MVRSGVVSHPAEWELSGYNEIQYPPDRYGVIDRQGLQQLCGFSDHAEFTAQHRKWIQETITEGRIQRENCWTESLAVGSLKFIEETKTKLGFSSKEGRIEEPDGICMLREESEPYNADFAPNNEALSAENAYFWDDFRVISGC
jgi:hypothetical protein